MSDLLARLGQRALVSDGAKGSLLIAMGADPSGHLDHLNLTAPDLVEGIHRQYVQAGADIVVTNTFRSSRPGLEEHGLADQVEAINREGVKLAKRSGAAHVFASVVPSWAREGRLRSRSLLGVLRHDLALPISALVAAIPLLLAAWDLVPLHASYQLSVALMVAMLFLLAVSLSRRDGLAWTSALLAGLAIVAATLAVTWLESRVH